MLFHVSLANRAAATTVDMYNLIQFDILLPLNGLLFVNVKYTKSREQLPCELSRVYIKYVAGYKNPGRATCIRLYMSTDTSSKQCSTVQDLG